MEALHQQATDLFLIERDRLPTDGTIAILGDQDADDAERVGYEIGIDRLRFFSRFYGDEQAYRQRGLSVCSDWAPAEDPNVRAVVIFQSREKEVTDLRVGVALQAFPRADEILLIGHKKLGIKSMAKRYASSFEHVETLHNARHCTSICLRSPHATTPKGLDAFWRTWPMSIDGQIVQVTDLPGVFSRGELDRGSEMLIQNLGDLSGKEILDVGCGAGLLSIAAALRYRDCHLTLVDHDSLAVASARANCVQRGVADRVTVIFGELAQVGGKKFDRIITNPPFHVGSQTTTRVSEHWVATIGKKMKSNGQLRMVANRHLPYAGPLQEAFHDVQLLDEDSKYKVWLALKPR